MSLWSHNSNVFYGDVWTIYVCAIYHGSLSDRELRCAWYHRNRFSSRFPSEKWTTEFQHKVLWQVIVEECFALSRGCFTLLMTQSTSTMVDNYSTDVSSRFGILCENYNWPRSNVFSFVLLKSVISKTSFTRNCVGTDLSEYGEWVSRNAKIDILPPSHLISTRSRYRCTWTGNARHKPKRRDGIYLIESCRNI